MSGQFDETGTVAEHVAAGSAGGLVRSRQPAALDSDQPEGHCANCAAELQGPVCHMCGQPDDSFHRPILSTVGQFLEGVFHLDGRLAQTLPALMARPGSVTRSYLKGARVRFIPPLRLYLLASLLFFLLVGLFARIDIGPVDFAGAGETRAALDEALASGELTRDEYDQALSIMSGIGLTGEPAVSDGLTVPSGDGPVGDGSDPAASVASDPVVTLPELAGRLERIRDNPDAWASATIAWIPRLMFALVPVYAALLALSFAWRRGYFYYDHLIVSLHFHAALFLAMSLGFAIAPLVGIGWIVLALIVYSNIYLYRLMRVVYERGRATAVLRVFALDFVYLLILTTALIAALVLGVMTV